jgi:hypothetical protein
LSVLPDQRAPVKAKGLQFLERTWPKRIRRGAMHLDLYTRDECHLCDLARGLLQEVAPDLPVRAVNIDQDIELLRRYGTRVPVLQHSVSGAELGWPFDATGLRLFLADQDR